MQVILTGSTGYIGKEVLFQALQHPAITSIIALSRREIPFNNDPRVKTIIMKDFNVYSDDILKQLKEADACVWSMGSYDGNSTVEIDYPLAFANAMERFVMGRDKKFRYIHLSGALTESDPNRALWYAQTGRRGCGQGELAVLNFAHGSEHLDHWETIVVKPGGVLWKDSLPATILGILVAPIHTMIKVDELAICMVDAAVWKSGEAWGEIVDCKTMVARGRKLLEEQKSRADRPKF